MTLPDAAAAIGVPYPAAMSIPSCIRPQRQPNGLTTGPLTGQTKPLADGVESVDVEYVTVACAERIWAATLALWARRADAWAAYSFASVRVSASAPCFSLRAFERPCRCATSCVLITRCCSVRTLTTRVTAATRA